MPMSELVCVCFSLCVCMFEWVGLRGDGYWLVDDSLCVCARMGEFGVCVYLCMGIWDCVEKWVGVWVSQSDGLTLIDSLT